MRQSRVLALLLGVCLLLMTTVIQGQESTTTGSINNDGDIVEFQFELGAGQLFIAQTESTSGNLDTVLTLSDPNGEVLAENDDIDYDGGNYNSIISYTVTQDGTYTLTVSAFQGTGDFNLYTAIQDGIALPEGSFFGQELILTGEVTTPNQPTTTELNITEGSRVLLQTQSIDTLDTIMEVYTPDGALLAANNDANLSAGNFNSLIFFTAPVSGTYTVSINGDLDSVGAFYLSALLVGEGTTGVFRGSIAESEETQEFVVTLSEGQYILASTQSITGDVDTVMTLFAPDGSAIVENDDINIDEGNYNSAISFTAAEAGDYVISIGSYSGTLGDFLLTVNGLGAGVSEQPAASIDTASSAQLFEGEITANSSESRYPIALEQGQTIYIEASAQTEGLDTIAGLFSESGEQLALNDDRNTNTRDSALAYEVETSGTYVIVVGSYGGTTGSFQVRATVGGPELFARLNESKRVEFTGPELTRETPNFIIHFTQHGADATTPEYVNTTAQYLEEAWALIIGDLGWTAPPPDNNAGGDNRLDVYLSDIFNQENGCILGYASPDIDSAGDNPATAQVELYASPSYLVIDNDFDQSECGGTKPAYSLLRATAVHELHHNIQFTYDAVEPARWLFEATATWMETQGAGIDQDATGYVTELFTYPELCLGTRENSIRYGTYLFIDSMAQNHGNEFITTIWQSIVDLDGFDALNAALAQVDSNVTYEAMFFNIRNFTQTYPLADQFQGSVFIENTISDLGTWTFRGNGIQELAANFYIVPLRGELDVAVNNGMVLFGIGISGTNADIFAVGNSGTIDTSPYELYALMVFNPQYDNDTSECSFADYQINVSAGTGTPVQPNVTLDATGLVSKLGN